MAQCDSIRDDNLHHWVRGLTGNCYHIYTSLSFSQFWGSHPLSLLFLICGTSNLGRQLLAMMEEFIADDDPIEKNQEMNTMHTRTSKPQPFEGAAELLRIQDLAQDL